MASVTTRPNGHRWITFKAPNGKRQTIRLGAADETQANNFKGKIEKLLVCRRLAELPDAKTIEWLSQLPEGIHDTLAKCGLVDPRGARTVGELVAWYIAVNPQWKPSTLVNVKNVGEALIRFFGRERRLALITTDDGVKFRQWLERDGKVYGGELEATTASRMCRRAREIFRPAVKRRWILENPFGELKQWVDTNPDRDEYITLAQFTAVMKECDADTRLFYSLVRLAGLRGYSEIMPLELTWVDWSHRTLFVKAPKTEHHQGQESRFVPLCEELYGQLMKASELAPEGARFLFGEMRITNTAIDNRLAAACRRAKVIMWPKPKINLRASCEADWLRTYPIDMVATWMGHSPETMLKHYRRVFKEQTARVAGSALQAHVEAIQRAS
jgi:integrase